MGSFSPPCGKEKTLISDHVEMLLNFVIWVRSAKPRFLTKLSPTPPRSLERECPRLPPALQSLQLGQGAVQLLLQRGLVAQDFVKDLWTGQHRRRLPRLLFHGFPLFTALPVPFCDTMRRSMQVRAVFLFSSRRAASSVRSGLGQAKTQFL